ncbi:hypothetical protein E2C01_017778 [Portunus trituberculatus]|uniref:Uncharacterized protein n=1 Tax=Portunus trituberculatus TaxID=210409 RepID=A0A5B7DSV8_PORTR|nr:hypothetical protein [Portunus trituberculatus]
MKELTYSLSVGLLRITRRRGDMLQALKILQNRDHTRDTSQEQQNNNELEKYCRIKCPETSVLV